VSGVTPNFTPYVGTAVLAMSIQWAFDGELEYPEKAPPEKTAGVILGTRSIIASSSPWIVTTLSYCIISVIAAGAVASSRSIQRYIVGTAAFGEEVLNTETAFDRERTWRRTRSIRYWSKRLENAETLAKSASANATAPNTAVAEFCWMALPDIPVELLNVCVICLVLSRAPGIGRVGILMKL